MRLERATKTGSAAICSASQTEGSTKFACPREKEKDFAGGLCLHVVIHDILNRVAPRMHHSNP